MSGWGGTVLVYLKYPEPGRVKTRLAATVGPARAVELYREWIGHVFERLQPLRPAVSVIGAIDGAAPEAFSPWVSFVDGWWQQPAGDLGHRLDAGFKQFHNANAPVLAVGTDCLELDADGIREALTRLLNCDAVFGPTGDGGYYLVGTSRYLPGFFDAIRWSSSDTLRDHLARCRDHNWRTELLPQLDDIDTGADWEAYRARTGGRASEPRLPTVAVVIPVLDEENGLPQTLNSLRNQSIPPDRVIVVDGGSRDRTVEVARELGAEVLATATRGRGNQAAVGIAAVTEEVVLVGHADMVFPPDALRRIGRHLLEHPGCPGGSLGHRFDSNRWRYRLVEWFDRRRAESGMSYGDQAQFFRREWLDRAGGFPAQSILEDVELSARLRASGRPACLNCPVTVSPRRFERLGLVRALWQNWQVRRAYRRGGVAAVHSLYERYYPPPRSRDGRRDSSR